MAQSKLPVLSKPNPEGRDQIDICKIVRRDKWEKKSNYINTIILHSTLP